MVIVDVRTEDCHAMNASASMVWEVLKTGGTQQDAVIALAAKYPAESRDRLRADVAALADDMRHAGLLSADHRQRPPTVEFLEEHKIAETHRDGVDGALGTDPAGVPMASRLGGRPSITGMVFLVFAVLLLALPFRITYGVARGIHRRRDRRPLTVTEAERMMSTVKRTAAMFPFRAACLEVSLATVLWAASSRRQVDWCLGVFPDPYNFHAWVEAQGQRIETEEDRSLEPPYHRLAPVGTKK
ncbi:lasso peptide biosynthesis B2 protein [Streptosporangium sp. 'caverna']|uniref:lasso peptide biosynthesis B2 protein n=1 Tax=Streptosporangium sp. 'caverna' TaxID=2202249 RepID=UPI0013A6C95D|nr:lasso peptide biosynthesis B2 protein [Streptosporangium sp. 'caverna']